MTDNTQAYTGALGLDNQMTRNAVVFALGLLLLLWVAGAYVVGIPIIITRKLARKVRLTPPLLMFRNMMHGVWYRAAT